jgi:integrase
MLRKEHLLFYEQNKPSGLSSAKKITNEKQLAAASFGLLDPPQRDLNSHEFTAHSLRQTTAETILRAGGSIQDAQGVLRHSSSVTTQIYIQSLTEEVRLKNPAEKLIDTMF